MNKKPSISFFCPAYNDEENLPSLVEKTMQVLQQLCSKFEIIIIDDASPDNTSNIADNLAKKYAPNIKVIHHIKNKGYGGALLSGFHQAKKYPYVFYTDGDNQYDVSDLKRMLPFIHTYDAVIGTRIQRNLNWKRKLQSNVYNMIIRFLFGLNCDDINCAIRLFRRKTIDKLNLFSTSAFLPAEILIELKKHGGRIKEVEVKHYLRLHGEASGGKLSVILPTFLDMIRYYCLKKTDK